MKRRVQSLMTLVAGLAIALSGLVAIAAGPQEKALAAADTPIIAEVFSQPDAFVGRRVKIYGLVVETRKSGQRFFLQDVSQMPLPVTAPAGHPVAVGDQLMVSGTVRRIAGQLVLSSEDLLYVQVVAGGGCC